MTELTQPAGAIARVTRLPLLAPLRTRDFRLVWFGESVSLLGDQFHYVALSWLVLGLTGSGLALGTVLLAAALPRGAFLLVGGVLSDRVSPRTLMLSSNLVRAAITTVIAALVLGARVEIWQLVLAGALFGTVDAFFYPAMNTIVARLVPEEQLGAANAALQGTQQLMSTVGPALAGFAIAIIGVGAAFAIDAASFAVAATAVWLVGTVRAVPPALAVDPFEMPTAPTGLTSPAETIDASAPVVPAHGSMFASLGEGARAVMGDPVMRMLVLLSTAFNLAFTGPVVVGLPWLVQVRFAGDAALLGLLYAAFGAGSLAGVVLGGTVPRTRNLGAVLFPIVTVLGI
jgi:MFS family permease